MKWRWILWPFSLIYGSVTALRNLAFDRGFLASVSFQTPLIAVGNLSVGGTGKTPMVEFLIRRLDQYKSGMVSRGYGRKTKGLLIAGRDSTAEEIGDEPCQILNKFPHIHMAVSEKRAKGIEAIMEAYAPDVIILDDAFQHRYVNPGYQILLTTYHKPFFGDYILPAGDLRESRSGSARAQSIVVTKCPPDLSREKAETIEQKIAPAKDQKVYFTTLQYDTPLNYKKNTLKEASAVLALTGIARPAPFLEYIAGHYQVTGHQKFPDHHSFSHDEIHKIESILQKNTRLSLLTTEKDWMRLKPLLSQDVLSRVYYIPIEVRFLFGAEETFLQEIIRFIKTSRTIKPPVP